ncbi:FAD dependent pyridine nucleotide-disulfide oxidoreductase protein (plasmid) [Rhizobium sp. NXC14]|nr:FAD dependent pyridine nucleotide-disulfide oxidoreductase protein [Rhizobium sp. NXC14]
MHGCEPRGLFLKVAGSQRRAFRCSETVVEMGAHLEDIAGTVHTHPTRSEALMEAVLKAFGSALHI